ncbi:hypothetical protein ACH4U5_39510 [Streptomyces sp. NPDC020858]
MVDLAVGIVIGAAFTAA